MHPFSDGSDSLTCRAVRFGKFVERWSTDKTVTISVNGAFTNLVCTDTVLVVLPAPCAASEIALPTGDEMPFTMRLGRTGEAYFLREEGAGPAFEQPPCKCQCSFRMQTIQHEMVWSDGAWKSGASP